VDISLNLGTGGAYFVVYVVFTALTWRSVGSQWAGPAFCCEEDCRELQQATSHRHHA
jgi:hypothetical protein